ncbi:MAG: peptidoglycan DD-metalloendopeptidase family protein [Acidobacteria bacterium]|nr:peptidoglycan DD-metalloendopeptidase family protein [Acidobacteriota bacterium]
MIVRVVSSAAVVACLFAAAPRPALLYQSPPPAPRTQAEEQSRRAADRIRALQQESERLASRERTLLGELRRLEIERDLRTEEIRSLEPEISRLASDVAVTGARLSALEQAVREKQPVLAARLVDIYRMGRPGPVRLWFAVDDLRALGRASRLVSALARIDRDRLADYRASAATLAATRTGLEQRVARLTTLRDSARRARQAAGVSVASRLALIAEIDQRRDLNAQLVGELQQAHAKLVDMLSSLPAGAAPGPADAVVLPFRPFRGELDWPAEGDVASGFGPRRDPQFGTTTISSGIEIAAAEGASARAVHEGTVAFAGAFTGFGQLVVLDHGGQSYSLYGHLASLTVRRGMRVERGHALGVVGRGPTGRPSLYFELRIDGQPVDPVQWLKTKAGT